MTTDKTTHLQRIGEGLPVLARIEAGILYLSISNQPTRSWAEFAVEEKISSDAERYDATLEAFRKGERLGSAGILERGIANLLDDLETVVRLVLNHCEDGNPNVNPDWKAKGLAVVGRPTLAKAEGKASWTLARSLPCSEIRAYRQETDGSWTVEKESRNSSKTAIEEKRRSETKTDRYAAMCRSLPNRPLARPFTIRSIGRAEKDSSMNAYRM